MISFASPGSQRDAWLALDDEHLLRDCRLDFYKDQGPGGQKRNKASTAVRIIHHPSGLASTAAEERDQHINRIRALRRLRLAIAFEIRDQPKHAWQGEWGMNSKNPRYPLFAACVLDWLADQHWSVADAATHLGTSTGQLIKHLAKDEHLWQKVNQERQRRGLNVLRQS